MTITLSDASSPELTTLPVHVVWIKNPLNSAMNYHFLVETEWQQITVRRPSQDQQPLSTDRPLVIGEGVKGDKFPLTFLLLSEEDLSRIVDLLQSLDTLLVQTPRRQWFVQILGDPTISEHIWDIRDDGISARKVTVEFIEVDRPDV